MGHSHRLINDQIHGQIELDNFVFDFIDTAPFQRLRNISQLGSSQWVFPGALHNRFSHGIGTSFLAASLLSHLDTHRDAKRRYMSEDEYSKDKSLVTIAALCHDLGHGPFSHVFDDIIAPAMGCETTWRHEERSCGLVQTIVDAQHIDIAASDIKFVQSLIHPEKFYVNKNEETAFMWDIVANERNGLDVDKFDYIVRDSNSVGIKSPFDLWRLVKLSCVVGDQIGYSAKAAYDIFDLYSSRFQLTRKIYSHKTAKAIDLMLADIFAHADGALHIKDMVSAKDLDKFVALDESILGKIRRSKKPSLAKSKAVLSRIDRRDLYKLAGELFVAQTRWDSDTIKKQINPRTISQMGPKIAPSDLRVVSNVFKIGAHDSLLKTRFFYGKDVSNVKYLNETELGMYGDERELTVVRCFVAEPEKLASAKRCFESFKSERGFEV